MLGKPPPISQKVLAMNRMKPHLQVGLLFPKEEQRFLEDVWNTRRPPEIWMVLGACDVLHAGGGLKKVEASRPKAGALGLRCCVDGRIAVVTRTVKLDRCLSGGTGSWYGRDYTEWTGPLDESWVRTASRGRTIDLTWARCRHERETETGGPGAHPNETCRGLSERLPRRTPLPSQSSDVRARA